MDKQNKFYDTWWFWVIVGIVIIVSVGMITEEKTTKEIDSGEFDYETTKQEEYPKEMESAYMEECVYSPKMEDYCQCTWNYLTDEMTVEEFADTSFEFDKTGEMPDVMREAFDECSHKIEY